MVSVSSGALAPTNHPRPDVCMRSYSIPSVPLVLSLVHQDGLTAVPEF